MPQKITDVMIEGYDGPFYSDLTDKLTKSFEDNPIINVFFLDILFSKNVLSHIRTYIPKKNKETWYCCSEFMFGRLRVLIAFPYKSDALTAKNDVAYYVKGNISQDKIDELLTSVDNFLNEVSGAK